MSTFRGFFVDEQLNFIAVDHFGDHVYDCDVFLLSHHHCDHMQGIYTQSFGKLVNESSAKFLYCSPLTSHFLRKNRRCPVYDDKIVDLQINKPFVIRHERVRTDVVITCLPAAHCPGSVMFLIEYDKKRILYSGDIRLTVKDLKYLQGILTNFDGSVIEIDDLYLDTTFACHTPFLKNFPSRENSAKTVIDLMKTYLSDSLEQKVVLHISANFGYESLYINLCKTFKKPIMVHEYLMKYYEDIEEIRDYLRSYSDCKDDWLVHACLQPSTCKLIQGKPLNRIKACAQYFVNFWSTNVKFHKEHNVPYVDVYSHTKVFYSTHCSLNELRDIYKFLKPKRVFPSVRNNRSVKEILSLIEGDNDKDSTFSNNHNSGGLRVLPSNQKRNREEYESRRLEIRKRMKLAD